MRRWSLAVMALTLCLAANVVVLAQTTSYPSSPYIYKLHIGGCRYPPAERTLTGFRVKGQIGIVTALHGVAGCTTLNAQPAPDAPGPFNQLIIGKVDLDHDVALLWSKELAALPADGLEAVANPQTSDYAEVKVIGYPYGLFRQKPTLEVKIVETTELGNLLPPDLILALSERDSPAIDINVLSVQAHLVPGHSGAPLLNKAGRVIGVGNGGLDLGRVEMGWAIPWQTITWQTVATPVAQAVSWKDFRRLQALANSDPHLFAFAPPDEIGGGSATPPAVSTATATPKATATPRKLKLIIKVNGAGSARSIALEAPPGIEQP